VSAEPARAEALVNLIERLSFSASCWAKIVSRSNTPLNTEGKKPPPLVTTTAWSFRNLADVIVRV
jgi:hypothetical protein